MNEQRRLMLSQLEELAFQGLLLEYESDCRSTPSGCYLPIPPPRSMVKGLRPSLDTIGRVSDCLNTRWRSAANITPEGGQRIGRFDLWQEFRILCELPGNKRMLEEARALIEKQG